MTDIMESTFPNRFKLLRIKNHKTREQLSIDLDISLSTLDHWAMGDRRPTRKMQAKLADYFHVSVDYLMGRSEESGDERYCDLLESYTEKESYFLLQYRLASEEAKVIVKTLLNYK